MVGGARQRGDSFMSAFGSEATKESYKAVNGLVDCRVPPWSLELSFDGSLRGYMTPCTHKRM